MSFKVVHLKLKKVLKELSAILIIVMIGVFLNACSKKDWGITFTAENITPTGLTLKCTQSGGNATGSLETGSWFGIERLTENKKWEEVEFLNPDIDVSWTLEAISIPPNSSCEWNIKWESLYGELPPGSYRIGKEIIDFRKTADYDKQIYYAEFEINYPWEIGEKSNLDLYSEDNIQLELVESKLSPSGAEFVLKTDEFIKYGEEFIIEIQLDGRWYSIKEEFDWHAIESTMQSGTERVLEIDWSSRYGDLPVGKYRFIKPITVSESEKYVCCEFEL